MAPVLFTIFLVALACVVVTVNVALWIRLGRWFHKDERPGNFALVAARLSILLTFNAWFLSALLMFESRAVLRGSDAAPIHLMASRGQGWMLALASMVIAWLTPLIIAAALFCGVIGVVRGRRIKDDRARKIGLIGVLLNSALILLGCGLLGASVLPRSTNTTNNTAPANTADEDDHRRTQRNSAP